MKQYLSKYKNKTKYLINKKKKNAGRNNTGRITVFHQGGGHKRIYRKIEFKNTLQPGTVVNFEYDPNRSSYIAKICYLKNKKKYYYYLLAPKNLNILDNISNDNLATSKNVGNRYFLKDFNIGNFIYNIELKPNKGGQIARSAGTCGQILQKTNDNYVLVKMPSGEHRLIPANCKASLGTVSNEEHKNRIIKKAGKSRWLNIRPTVRGVAMNPVDHPHGGGEGKTSGGRPSVTPWGRYTKGQPTRSKKNNKLIIKRSKRK